MQATTQTIGQTGTRARTFAVLNIVAGGLLFVAPWVLGYSGETAAFVTSLVVGAVTALAALLAATVQRSWSWIAVAAGAYSVIAALVIGGSGAAIATGMVLGLAIGILGLVTAVTPE